MARSKFFARWRSCRDWHDTRRGSCPHLPDGAQAPRRGELTAHPPRRGVWGYVGRRTSDTGATMIQFKQEICRDLDAALRREWLETNGLGGFASSTIIGLNTRRYHGLLVAATKPPVGRFVLLSKLEETLFIEGQAFELSANRYPGVVHPQGFRYLKQFRLDPFPVFTYEVEGIEIEKSVFMIQGENSTVVHYELKKNNHPESPKNLWLELRPLIAFRDYHSTTHENGAINRDVEERSGLASVSPHQGLPSLYLAHNAVDLRKTGDWYRNFEYDAERERGLDFSEDLFNPLVLRFDLRLRRQASVIASTEQRDVAKVVEPIWHTPGIWNLCATNSIPCSQTLLPGTPGAHVTESKWTQAAC